MFIQTSNTATGALVGEKLYYTHTDFQGSLTALTNEDGTVAERYAYNPWGARRNPTDWTQTDARTSLITDRGYTGHEHIDLFRVINMNGRVYDPTTAQFLSPDPMLQAPGDWLNYNRYTYCMNNPLKYTDPSGYEAYPGPAWYDSSLGGWRYLDAYNQMHVISGGEVQEINSRAMAARNGTLRYQTSEVQESSRYLSDAPGLVSAFDEYCGKLDYIQRYGSDLYKAAKESGAVTSQSYTEFLTNTLLKADFSSGFLKIANYVQVDGFIGGIVNKDGKMYGKSLIGGAMAAHISDTYIKVPGQSAGQGSGEGSVFGEGFINGLGNVNDMAEFAGKALRNTTLVGASKLASPLIDVYKLGIASEKDKFSIGRNTVIQGSKIAIGVSVAGYGVSGGAYVGGIIGGGIGLLCGGFGAVPGVVIGQAVGGALGSYLSVSYSLNLVDSVATQIK